jgi:predicted DCC family thiol-disulfide oxidoreductase YuxK
VSARLASLIRVDLRSVALFRVGLAAITLVDLAGRLCEVHAFYADDGLLPRKVLIDLADPWAASLHLASGSGALITAALLLQLLLAVFVLAGARARVCAMASFVLLASLNARNPWVLLPGDALIVALWFWAMFLPLSARWSLDAALLPAEATDHAHRSWGVVGLVLHLACAVGLSLGLGWPLGVAPLVVGALILLPAAFWERTTRLLDHDRRLRIYYDKDCAACRTFCQLLVHLLILPRTELAAAQDQARMRALMESRNSWVVVDAGDVAHTKWRGFVAVLRHSLLLRWLAPLAGLALWERPGDGLYDCLARHRQGLLACVPHNAAAALLPGAGAQRIALLFAVLLLPWTLAKLDLLPAAAARPVAALFVLAGLDPAQEIAPRARPLRPVGRRAEGQDINLFAPDVTLFQDEPAHASRRWRAWQAQLSRGDRGPQRALYVAYLCRHWSAAGRPPLESVRLVDLVPRDEAPGSQAYEQQVLWREACRS